MKKSEQYTRAMMSVIDDGRITPVSRLEILETLMSERNIARMIEEHEAERAEEDDDE